MLDRPTKTVIFTYQQLSNIGCEIIIRGSIKFMRDAYPQYRLKFVVTSYQADRDRRVLSDIEDIEVNKEVENIVKVTQDKTALESKQNLRPIKEAFTIIEWLRSSVHINYF